ncbi:hypothetical protein BGZ81_007563 [Podila clonocystis]|nr:hypothetical protein BGZ81_007563 [Podila clonocystis]
MTDIKLLPSSKSFRCFPYSDGSRALSIHTNDGRHLVLRANKDTELERCQLAAHQQSAQLFQKYLQKQYHQPKDQNDQEFSTLPPTQTQQVQIMQPPKMLRPPLNRPRESFLHYQIPAPARVSAFLPQGFDWSQQEGDEDDLPVGFSSYDSPPLSGERRPLTRHPSHSHTAVSSMGNRELSRSASASMVPQRFGVPAASSMEPSKAAIIDHWRRSLMSPLLLEEASNPGNQEVPENGTKDANAEGDDDDEPLVPEYPKTESRDIESRHNSHEFEDGIDSKRVSIWHTENDPPNVSDDDTPIATSLYSRLPHGRGRSYIGHHRSSFLPGMTVQEEEEEEAPVVVKLREALDSTVQQLAVRDNANERGEEDELPLGLLHVNRHSRWLNTQLSSEDGASAINPDSHVEGHLPSEPVAEIKSRDSEEVHHSDPDLDLDRLTPPHSNPSLSFHGSSYSHLPIHDPEFVFPHADPSVTLVNTPTSLQFEISNSPSIPPPMRPPRPNLSVDLTAFSNNASATGISPPKGGVSPGMVKHTTNEDLALHRSFSSPNISIHPHAIMPGVKKIRPMGDKNNKHQRNDGDDDDDEEPLVHTLSRQQSQRKHKIQMHIQVPPLNNSINHNHNLHNHANAKVGHGYTLRDQATPPPSDESFQYF